MSAYNTLGHYLTQPNRFHNPYTVMFVSPASEILCECCASQIFKDDRDHDEEYIEVPNPETFGFHCSECQEDIEPDCGYPTDFIEFVETLEHQGWCKRSAKKFARHNIDNAFVFEQAALHLKELMDIGDQDFGNCEEDISYKYDLNTEDMQQVKALYDAEDAKLCLQM